ncbi:hypothetical protein JCM10213_006592 [Rhodosporidiobolus nylandii]
MFRFLSAAVLTFSSISYVSADEPPPPRHLTVYHRFADASYSVAQDFSLSATGKHGWVERGQIEIVGGEEATFVPSPDAWEGFVAPLNAGERNDDAGEHDQRYQLAVRDAAWGDEGEVSFVSVEPCTLYSKPSSPLSEHLTLSWTSPSADIPSSFGGALAYRTSSSIESSACDRSASAKERARFTLEGLKKAKVEVRLERPAAVELKKPAHPELPKDQQKPVVLDKDGKIIPPPKEKSFIQKYWMYIVPVLLIILLNGGEAPQEGQGQGGQAGGGGAKR